MHPYGEVGKGRFTAAMTGGSADGDDMKDDVDPKLARQLTELFDEALGAVIRAIRAELAKGRTPRQKTGEPSLTMRDNGMPSLTNGSYYEERGPLQYADLLEPPRPPGGPS